MDRVRVRLHLRIGGRGAVVARIVKSYAIVALCLDCRFLECQTFVQLTDLGSGIGLRLTKAVAQSRLGVDLFGEIGTKVTFIDYGTVYEFASDPSWGRVLSGKKDEWVHEFTNATGPGGRFRRPLGVDISARRRFYVADRSSGRIIRATFDPSAQNIVVPAEWTSGDLPRPVDIAWDGQISPLTQDFVYVLDDSLSRVSYWDANGTSSPVFVWRYGGVGSGVGQFARPSGVCVGKTPASNGGTQFAANFYVVDRGNRRVVWLQRSSGGANWLGVASLPAWDPADCAVDHFGNLYVTDEGSHRIHKLTYSLSLLDSYGAYGKGAVLNTFAFPRAISVPCGLKIVNSQGVWYCEGRVITAEAWTSVSGAVEHYLGIASSILGQPASDPQPGGAEGHVLTYSVTDHASHSLEVMDPYGSYFLYPADCSPCPPGTRAVYWDGLKPDGQPTATGYFKMVVRVNSAYGCPSGATWCHRDVISEPFWHEGGAPPPSCDPPPCPERPTVVGIGGVEPTTLFLRQRLVTAPRPLARVVAPDLGQAAAPSPDVSGSLSSAVREFGIRGLTFGVTRASATQPVTLHVHALSGRLVRVLVNQRLDPGVYEIGWDGNDGQGRPASPGVYLAVMNLGSYRATQRLILRQP